MKLVKTMTGTEVKRDLNQEPLVNQVQDIVAKIQKQTHILLLFWAIIVVALTALFYMTLEWSFPPARMLIYAFLFAIVTINWYVSLPFIGVMGVIIKRTKSRNYLAQLVPTVGLLLLGTIVALSNAVEFQEESVGIKIYIGSLLVIIVLELIFLRLQISGIKENKKPLFFWTFFQDTREAYTSSILSQQALEIWEGQDGYSQRPFFTPFPELRKYRTSNLTPQAHLERYAKFLTEKSELIGWERTPNSMILYPRVLFGYADYGMGILYLWKLFYRLITKKRLTMITVNLEVEELALRITREDYALLNNVTYHLLGFQLLERFKQSILAYLEGDLKKAYSVLLPLKR